MTKQVIELKHINKTFKDVKALDDVNLTINEGEIVCLIGPSGSGKSTLIRAINGLEKPDSGTVSIFGKDYQEQQKNYQELRSKMGFVFQHFNLFPNMTVLENLTLAPIKAKHLSKDESIKIAIDYLEKVGLKDKKDVYPNKLSGGQKQRVAIARALCTKPEMMLFDEPTSALDPEMVGEVLQVMQDLAKEGMTMIIVTHEMGFAKEVADRVVFLENGKIIEENSAKEFFENPQSARAQDFLSKVMHS